jgi:hypothetical protein
MMGVLEVDPTRGAIDGALSPPLKTLRAFSPRPEILASDDQAPAKAPPTAGVSPRNVA